MNDRTEHQRCKACGKEWPRYRAGVGGALFLIVVLLPQFWFHFHFGCQKRGANG